MTVSNVGLLLMVLAIVVAFIGWASTYDRLRLAKRDARHQELQANSARADRNVAHAERDGWERSAKDAQRLTARSVETFAALQTITQAQYETINSMHREIVELKTHQLVAIEPPQPIIIDIADPPTVGDADRAIVEADKKRDRKKRPLDSGHVPLSTQDPERKPVHRASDREVL